MMMMESGSAIWRGGGVLLSSQGEERRVRVERSLLERGFWLMSMVIAAGVLTLRRGFRKVEVDLLRVLELVHDGREVGEEAPDVPPVEEEGYHDGVGEDEDDKVEPVFLKEQLLQLSWGIATIILFGFPGGFGSGHPIHLTKYSLRVARSIS